MRTTPVELVYGVSSSGKTNWVMEIAEALVKKGKKTMVYSGDGGVGTILDYTTEEGANLYEEGMVRVYQFTTHNHPFETCQFITRGCVPAEWEDPDSKWIEPKNLAEEYGMFVFEGLTAMSDYLMSYVEGGLAEQAGRDGIKLGGGLDAPFKVRDGSITLGGVSQSGYGFVQRVMKTMIENTRTLPHLVYWTAHQVEIEDKEDRLVMIGPAVAGKALTSKIGASFGNTIHLDKVAKQKKMKVNGKEEDVLVTERRAYWDTHFDPDQRNGMRYYANTRVRADRIAKEFREEFERGWMSPPSPQRFYEMLRSGRKEAKS